METRDLDKKIANFWCPLGYVPGASPEELDEAERRIGFCLPSDLRRLLGLRDGGVSNYDLIGDLLFAPVRGVANRAGTGDIAELYLLGGVNELPSKTVIFAADANAWFALDYRISPKEPSVLHWSEYQETVVQLAPTFREFLEKLSSD